MVRLEDLQKTYGGQKGVAVRALRGIDLEIAAGDFVAIMGSSGSGKSTLMNILGCLDRPTAGRYWLDGTDAANLSREERADVRNRKIGFVFQNFHLLPRTSALENVEMPMLYHPQKVRAREIDQRARDALGRVGLGDRLDHSPNQLSGGQQQRVAIARALVNEPRILLADEPTGNLDSRTTLDIMELFQELNKEGLTVLLVTHEPELCRFCKRVVWMRDGRIYRDEAVSDRVTVAAARASGDLFNEGEGP
ncbi:MAG: ABC transporter ATP-binding protein [Opitutales bacterium]|nr:ABC transporter ATP-binding protein [Opitutales bacterium]